MKKVNYLILTLVFLLVSAVIVGMVIFKIPPFQQTALNPTFTPIYCNDYEFTCCSEHTDSTYNAAWTNKQGDIFTCLISGDYCNVVYSNNAFIVVAPNYLTGTYVDLYVTNDITKCTWKNDILNPAGYYCPDAASLGHSVNGRINPGQSVYIKPLGTVNSVSINTVTIKSRLDFCGKAGCTVGVPVSGANKCTFLTDKSIYGTSGNLIRNVQPSAISYTVPKDTCILAWQSGDRHICGNKEEQCNIDTDCSEHTYGRYECNARNLQEYGCRKYNSVYTQSDVDLGFLQNKDLSYAASRCEIVSTKTVQCCGDTDCGSNAFCDRSTWTCQASAQCSQNSDCGVSQQCDYTTKQIKTPKCTLNQCGYALQDVECCLDVNCPSGYYCDTDRKCKENAVVKQACPYGCCVNEQKYFDKLCTTGNECCKSTTGAGQCLAQCAVPPNECTPWVKLPESLGGAVLIPDIFCEIGKWFKNTFSGLFLALGIVLGLITFGFLVLASRTVATTQKIKQDWIFWTIVLVVSIGLSLFIFYITSQFWWLALIITAIIVGINIALKVFLK